MLGEDLKAVKDGCKGELCITGPNISPGYYNEPTLTAEKFIQNPEIKGYPSIIYRTGDLVVEDNGLLHFAGRVDNQIKHMGYRIEVEEIEAAIHGIEGVEQCVVIYVRNNERFGRLVALVQRQDNNQITAVELSTLASKNIPKYMLPNETFFIENLPKNASGKIDRKSAHELYEALYNKS